MMKGRLQNGASWAELKCCRAVRSFRVEAIVTAGMFRAWPPGPASLTPLSSHRPLRSTAVAASIRREKCEAPFGSSL